MKEPTPHHLAGLTWVEFIVSVAVILACLILFVGPGDFFMAQNIRRARLTQTLSNMRQLQLATAQMAADGLSVRDPKLGWPGDPGGSFTNWVAKLVPDYLSTNDFCKLLSIVGKRIPDGKLPGANSNGILVYAARADSPSNTVFLSSANFTNTPTGGQPIDAAAQPFLNTGFVVFHRGGDGSILKARQVGQTNLVGAYAPLLP